MNILDIFFSNFVFFLFIFPKDLSLVVGVLFVMDVLLSFCWCILPLYVGMLSLFNKNCLTSLKKKRAEV